MSDALRVVAVLALIAGNAFFVARALRPAVWVLQRSARLVLRPFGVQDVVGGDAVTTPEELRALVDEAGAASDPPGPGGASAQRLRLRPP